MFRADSAMTDVGYMVSKSANHSAITFWSFEIWISLYIDQNRKTGWTSKHERERKKWVRLLLCHVLVCLGWWPGLVSPSNAFINLLVIHTSTVCACVLYDVCYVVVFIHWSQIIAVAYNVTRKVCKDAREEKNNNNNHKWANERTNKTKYSYFSVMTTLIHLKIVCCCSL